MDKIIKLFIEEPERDFHIRQVSKILNKSPTTISKYLKEYEKKGLLISENKLNHLLFKANSENRNFKNIKTNHNLTQIHESGIIEHLNKEFNEPEAIILFGSFAKAENTKQSDIDILVITSNKKDIRLEKFEKKLEHKIQLHLYSNKEIENMKTKNKELLNNIINGIKLSGYFELMK